jgi:transcriptional regulator with XRE-family HTH domain
MIKSSEFRNYTALKILGLYHDHNKTVREMCDIMGVTRHTWTATMLVRREVKTFEIYRLACYFQCDIDYFFPPLERS